MNTDLAFEIVTYAVIAAIAFFTVILIAGVWDKDTKSGRGRGR
jgi:hypothetical protein